MGVCVCGGHEGNSDLVSQSSQRLVDRQADKMQKTMIPISVLILAWLWTIQGLPVLPEPLYPPQENFNLGRVSD